MTAPETIEKISRQQEPLTVRHPFSEQASRIEQLETAMGEIIGKIAMISYLNTNFKAIGWRKVIKDIIGIIRDILDIATNALTNNPAVNGPSTIPEARGNDKPHTGLADDNDGNTAGNATSATPDETAELVSGKPEGTEIIGSGKIETRR